MSPAQIVFGRELRDTLPFKPEKGVMHKEWMITSEDREKAFAKMHHTNMESLNEHVKELKPLQVGQSVFVLNQAGNHGKRWSRSGTLVEIGPGQRQYAVRMDGSRNVSIRNRKFLRTYIGVADLMSDDVPQQHPHEESGPAAQMIRQEEVSVDQPQAVDLGGGDNRGDKTAEQQPLSTMPAGQDTGGAETGASRRYPGRERKKPSRFKDLFIRSLLTSCS